MGTQAETNVAIERRKMRVQFVGLSRIVSGASPAGAWRIKHGDVSKRLSSSAEIEVCSDNNMVEQGEALVLLSGPASI
jgi:hypothetical protein